jgi:hypothetical protein
MEDVGQSQNATLGQVFLHFHLVNGDGQPACVLKNKAHGRNFSIQVLQLTCEI